MVRRGLVVRWVLTWPLLGGWPLPTNQPTPSADKCVRPRRHLCNPPPDVTQLQMHTLHDAPNIALLDNTPHHDYSQYVAICASLYFEVPYLAILCWIAVGCLLTAGADVTGHQMCTMQMSNCSASYTSSESTWSTMYCVCVVAECCVRK